MKTRKFDYLVVLQGCYAFGWEDLAAASNDLNGLREMRQNRREYRDNEGGSYRIIRRRVPVGG
jgi:hypothetical protein